MRTAVTLREQLRAIIGGMDGVIVALSGGVDSCLVAAVSVDVLGDRAIAMTGVSPSLAQAERAEARAFAAQIGIAHREVDTREIERPAYVENSPGRCFECKDELYGLLTAIATTETAGYTIVDGANLDDVGDYRPGREAARQHGVRSPLAEAGFTKADVRALAQEIGLSVWNKPAMACLASRIPYGNDVTSEKLAQIEQAERVLRDLGFRDLRVRHHGDVARVEIPRTEFERALAEPISGAIVAGIKAAGFSYVALDLEGFRSGSMNEVLPLHLLGHTSPAAAHD